MDPAFVPGGSHYFRVIKPPRSDHLAPRVWLCGAKVSSSRFFKSVISAFRAQKDCLVFLMRGNCTYFFSGPQGNIQFLCQCELFLRILASGCEWTCSVATF